MTDNKTNVELLHCYLRKQHKANGVDLIEDSLFIKLAWPRYFQKRRQSSTGFRHFSSVALMLAYIIGNSQEGLVIASISNIQGVDHLPLLSSSSLV